MYHDVSCLDGEIHYKVCRKLVPGEWTMEWENLSTRMMRSRHEDESRAIPLGFAPNDSVWASDKRTKGC